MPLSLLVRDGGSNGVQLACVGLRLKRRLLLQVEQLLVEPVKKKNDSAEKNKENKRKTTI